MLSGLSEAFLLDVVLLLELINASARVNELLLTGEEGVAIGAYFYLNVLFSGTCFKCSSARALDRCCFILGMDSLFHCRHRLYTLK